MTDQHQHRATPEHWALTESLRGSVLHLAAETSKLGHRVEALEATQHAHIEAGARCAVEQMRSRPGSWQRQDKLDRLIEQDRSNAQQLTLVERVQDAIGADTDYDTQLARAAIRVVAWWLQENPGPNSAWTAVARDLMDEASR